MSKHLNEIIARLGYANSPCLKYKSNNYDARTLTAHTNKVLNALSPFAVYMVDDEPFVLFFDEPTNQDEKKIINQRIWNAQIPVAIFCGTSTIKIYSGCTIDEKTHLLPEVENISFDVIDEINENSPFSFWEITDQNFWGNYSKQFSGKKLNDALLENLKYLTEKLKNDYKVSFATKLVLRLIFIRYLIDRGVNLGYDGFSFDVESSQKALLSLLDSRDALYALFTHLKVKFNGNLFEQDNEKVDELTEPALEVIKDFLSANISTRSGQLSLFDLYDFNIIPVELISNIYEILLGKEAQEKDNAFYTPKYLVDYVLDNSIDDHIKQSGTCRILDPSCGSGVFLVDSYRRMVEKTLNGEQYTQDDELLRNILKENIYGIDLNEDAINVAIFSLYLAVLDYKNPRTLTQFKLPPLKEENLLVCDFFDVKKLIWLQEISFDFIIGNPPWGDKPGKHTDYCKEYGYKHLLQNNDTCRCFVLRSKEFCGDNTVCSFVLKAKILYMRKGPSKRFREFLLTETKVMRVVELSSVRKQIFKGADAPAIILTYKFSDEDNTGNRFEHIAMKKNEFFRLFKIIVVEKTDIKSIKQNLLIENDWAWKTLVYGLTGDLDNLFKLKTLPTLEESINAQSPKIEKGRGMEYKDGKMDASHLLERDMLVSRNAISHFLMLGRTEKFSKSRVYRVSNKALFYAPYCLVMIGPDLDNYTMRAVYSETDYVFQAAIYAIKGSAEQKDFLLNITGLLNSKLYAYLNLMLGSSLGIEREQRLQDEILKLPFVFSKDIARQVERIHELKKQEGNFAVKEDAFTEIAVLDQTILEAFGLSDNEFVDYSLRITIPQLTGKNDSDTKRKASIQDYKIYGKAFHDYLSEIFASAGKHIQINAYPTIAKHYSAIEVVVLNEKPAEWLTVVDANADKQKIMFANLSVHKTNELFYSVKDVLYFEESSFYIIKPSYYKNWHPAIAKLDLMEVTDQILSRKTGGEE